MNKQDADILRTIIDNPYTNQRILAETSGHSLGVVNRSMKSLASGGYLTENNQPTGKAQEELNENAPRNAIILAAGFGMRMVPINLTTPKGLLEVNNEPLIERQIRQLHAAGIRDITVVVGFMKERFDYLIDEYDVKLVVNPHYAKKNNLTSLALTADLISNTYIVPCDVWCAVNPFRNHEMYSWYMVSDKLEEESDVRINRKMELVIIPQNTPGNQMTGIAYLLEKDAARIRDRICQLAVQERHSDDYWEIVLFEKGKMIVPAKVMSSKDVVEINTYEQLRELDSASSQLRSEALDVIADTFQIPIDQIRDITVLKKGMTNRSFLFTVNGDKYIMRIPGEGTDQLISREHEAEVYQTISGLGLCDDPVYISPANGYKITRYLDNIRVADPESEEDITRCMERLRSFHNMNLQVNHIFDIFGQIEYYETLWNGKPSIYKDYAKTKNNLFSLRSFIDSLEKSWSLTHIDAVPDNFLFYNEGGEEKLQFTDWEYAGMQDPHIDLAMWSVYSFYNRQQIDHLIDTYFENACPEDVRTKIYCYVAAAGLLWSNWCEYKSTLGVEFGEYAMKQYRYAKDYYRIAKSRIDGSKN